MTQISHIRKKEKATLNPGSSLHLHFFGNKPCPCQKSYMTFHRKLCTIHLRICREDKLYSTAAGNKIFILECCIYLHTTLARKKKKPGMWEFLVIRYKHVYFLQDYSWIPFEVISHHAHGGNLQAEKLEQKQGRSFWPHLQFCVE